MKRSWDLTFGFAPGSGQRFAQALGCISTEEYVRSVLNLHEALGEGVEAKIVAERAKFDPTSGEKLEDYKDTGEYLTIGYRFSVGAEDAEEWQIERELNFEGEQSASDFADALGLRADRDFCETMVQIKCALDRFGGQVFLRPHIHEEQVMGVLVHYEHIVRDAPPEPDSKLVEGDQSPGPQDSEGSERSSPDGESEAADSPAEPVEA